MSSSAAGRLRPIAADLLTQLDSLVPAVLDVIAGEIPELAADPRVRELLASTVQDNVVSALRIISGTSEESTPSAPPVAFEFARRLAQQGIPLTAMLRAYRLGQATFLQTVIRRLGESGLGVAEMTEASLEMSTFVFEFIDSVSEQVVAAYQQERDQWLRRRNATRLARVQAVLNGSVTDPHEIDAAVGLGLAGTVLGAVLWIDGRHGDDDSGSLDQQVAALAAELGCAARATLSVAADGSTVWAWFAGATAPAPDFVPAAGVRVALGRPGTGIDGFRLSHRQARQAQALALYAAPGHGPRVLTAVEVGPLALVDASAQDVRAWVGSALGALAADDEPAERLRETVWSWLASGGSLNTAAATLHLHKNTIQYRLRKAEEARGRPLSEERLELEVALLACRLLGRAVLADPAGH